MPLLREHRDELAALVGLTADALGIGTVFVEKDFWVTEVLRAATAPIELDARDGSRHRVNTVFKGGTSLSRVFGLIERFSEDVDLLVGFPPVDASNGARDRVLKGIRDAVTVHLALDAADVVTEGSPTTGVKRNTRYIYPTIGDKIAGVVSSGVLLEMGCRGGTYPTTTHALRSMIADHAVDVLGEPAGAWDEFAPVQVEVLAAERTLLEKLALLHDCAARSPDQGANERLVRGGRHLYDVYQLLSSEKVIEALDAIGHEGLMELCADIDEHSAAAGLSYTPRPANGYAGSPLLDPSSPCRQPLAKGYAQAMALVYGNQPSFAECIEMIGVHGARL